MQRCRAEKNAHSINTNGRTLTGASLKESCLQRQKAQAPKSAQGHGAEQVQKKELRIFEAPFPDLFAAESKMRSCTQGGTPSLEGKA